MRNALVIIMLAMPMTAHADADYSLTCQMKGNVATIYACNSGDSSEGNNEYITIRACRGSSCKSTYSLFYVYGRAGRCDKIGTKSFSGNFEYCTATFRD